MVGPALELINVVLGETFVTEIVPPVLAVAGADVEPREGLELVPRDGPVAIFGTREADPSASVAGTEREGAFRGEGVAAAVAALATVAVFGAGVAEEATVFAGARDAVEVMVFAGAGVAVEAKVFAGAGVAVEATVFAGAGVAVEATVFAGAGVAVEATVFAGAGVAVEATVFAGTGVPAEATVFVAVDFDPALGARVAAGEVSAIFSPVAPFFPASFPEAVEATLLVAAGSFAAVVVFEEDSLAGVCSGAWEAGEAEEADAATFAEGVARAFAVVAGAAAVDFEAVSLPVRVAAAGAGVAPDAATVLAVGVAPALTVFPEAFAGGVPPPLSPEATLFADAGPLFAMEAAFPAPSLPLAAAPFGPASFVTTRGWESVEADVAGAFALVDATPFSAGFALFVADGSAESPSIDRSPGARALRNCNRFA